MACPDPDAILAYVANDATEADRLAMRKHLDQCAECRQVVALTASDTAGTHRAFGRYRLGPVIDAGGMGVVYEATDPKLGRRVALKVLQTHAHAADLRREAAAMAALDHPAVAKVFDVGDTEGRDFIVMELLEGGTLHDWLHAKDRTRGEIVEAFCALADGLAAVHELGVVHRDVKPSNILVRDDDTLVLADFGLSQRDRLATDTDGPAQTATSSGPAGTPGYMAPEHLRGEAATTQSDQYSFALCLIEALARRRLPVRRLPVPARLKRVLARASSEDPKTRYPSMRAMSRALRQTAAPRAAWLVAGTSIPLLALFVVGSGMRAPAPSCEEQMEAQRAELQAAAAAARDANLGDAFEAALETTTDAWEERAAVACDGQAPVSTRPCLARQHRRLMHVLQGIADDRPGAALHWAATLELADARVCDDVENDSQAGDPALVARIDEAEVLAIRGAYEAALVILDPVVEQARARRSESVLPAALKLRSTIFNQRDDFDAALADARWAYEEASRLRRDAEVGTIAVRLAILSMVSGLDDPAPWFAAADAAQARLPQPSLALAADIAEAKAKRASFNGAYPEVVALAEEALALLEAASNGSLLRRADLWAIIGLARFEMTDYPGARQAIGETLQAMERAGRSGDAAHTDAKRLLSMVAGAQGKHAEQLELLEECRHALTLRPDAPPTMRVNLHENFAQAYGALGDYDAAIQELEQALGLLEQETLRPTYEAIISNTLAWVYIRAGRPADALAPVERAIIIEQASTGELGARGALVLVTKGVALAQTDQLDAADEEFGTAIELLAQGHGERAPQTMWARQLRARGLAERNPSDARAVIRDAIDVFTRSLGPTSPFVASAYRDDAEVSVMLGDIRAARESYRRAIELQAPTLASDHPDLVSLRAALSDLGSEDAGER